MSVRIKNEDFWGNNIGNLIRLHFSLVHDLVIHDPSQTLETEKKNVLISGDLDISFTLL